MTIITLRFMRIVLRYLIAISYKIGLPKDALDNKAELLVEDIENLIDKEK